MRKSQGRPSLAVAAELCTILRTSEAVISNASLALIFSGAGQAGQDVGLIRGWSESGSMVTGCVRERPWQLAAHVHRSRCEWGPNRKVDTPSSSLESSQRCLFRKPRGTAAHRGVFGHCLMETSESP